MAGGTRATTARTAGRTRPRARSWTNIRAHAAKQGRRYAERGYEAAKELAAWKSRVRTAWPGVSLRRVDTPARRIQFGDSAPVEIAAKLNGLTPADVAVELILTRALREAAPVSHSHELTATGQQSEGEHRFRIDLK